MKFQIDSVYHSGEEVVKAYGEKAKPFEIKLEELEHSTWRGGKHLIQVATIELESLEDLGLLCSKVGHSIIVDTTDNDPEINLPQLEIYDHYRE